MGTGCLKTLVSCRRTVRFHSTQRCMGGSGIRSALGATFGLCSRWEAGGLLQRACGAMSLGDCTVEMWGFYTDPFSPLTLFDFFADNLAGW